MVDEPPQSTTDQGAPWSAYAGIFVCTAGVLMAEVLLTRIFSFTIWYHLAYLTISTALLSFGAAGSLLAAFPDLLKNPPRLAGLAAVAAGITLILALVYLGRNPIDPVNMFAAPMPFFFGLMKYYVIICLPFLLSGIAIAVPLAAYPTAVNRLYAVDLTGAATGCGVAVAALTWIDGNATPVLAAITLVASGALYMNDLRMRSVIAVILVLLAASIPSASRWLPFEPAASKGLARQMAQDGFEPLFTQWSPVNRVDVARNEGGIRGGFWAIGIRKFFAGPLPDTISIQYDGHNGSNLYEIKGPESMAFLDYHILRMPYLFLDRPDVLVIGVGGGIDVHNALRRDAVHVTGAELQPITVRVLKDYYAEYCGRTFEQPNVEIIAAEGRHFVRSRDKVYDLIQITATDTFSAQAAGAYVLAESYLYTVEAMEDYFNHLSDDGVLCLVLGDIRYDDPEIPPPLATRMVLTAQAALRRQGVTDPAQHVLLATNKGQKGGMRSVIVVKKSPFTEDQITASETFGDSVDVEYLLAPGRLGLDRLTMIANLSTEKLPRALDEEDFYLNPITDDRPFFYHIVRWSNIFSGRGALWYFPGSAIGQIVLLLMLAQAVSIGGLLIAGPLLLRARAGLISRQTTQFLFYFLALGIGFMLIEISFVQKYILLLGYPTYSLSVTIVSLLVFAALGAALSRFGWAKPRRLIVGSLTIMAGLVAAEIFLLPILRDALLGASLATRIVVTVLLQCPLGLCLGTFFPTGVELVRQRAPGLIPWAWAINGIGSVAGTVLAVMLAMAIGFSNVALVAVAIYVLGALPLVISLKESDRA
jgi:hypothetical protein